MANMRRGDPEPSPGSPEIQYRPGMADEMLRELAPLLAEECLEQATSQLDELTAFRERALAQLAAQHDEITRLRAGAATASHVTPLRPSAALVGPCS